MIFFVKAVHKLAYLLATLTILLALLVSVARLMTPVLNEHRSDFEALASKMLQTPVAISQVHVSWQGYSPVISLEGVSILDPETKKPKLSVKQFRIAFSIWRTLIDRKIFVENLTVSGIHLMVSQDSSGKIQVGELASLNMKDTLTGASVKADAMIAWVFSQPKLSLENVDLRYVPVNQPERWLTFKEFSLRNTDAHHIVDGEAILHQDMPTKVDIHLIWEGDVRKLEQAQGRVYLYLEGLSLPQWIKKFSWADWQIKKGVASVKIWADWKNSQWERIQSKFQVYGLSLYSISQQRTEIIDRMSANIGWKREGNVQIYAGDDVLIDFSDHLWPSTSFTVKIASDATDHLSLKSINLSYLNLSDANRFVLLTSLASLDPVRKIVTTLNPRGAVHNLQATFSAGLTDTKAISLKTDFSGLTVNTWQYLPGLSNFGGSFVWDGQQGNIQLNSTHALLIMEKYFTQHVYFNKLLANILWKNDANNNWLVQAKNIKFKTDDNAATADLAITIPKTGSPLIDMTANFVVSNTSHIVNYIPTKICDPDLAQWLGQAFQKGSLKSGNVIIKGPISKFPFDNNTGKFLVSAKANNLDFNFAPGWPLIRHIKGELIFAGRVMTVKVDSGQIDNVPISNVVGVIPYIGDAKPQILHVNGLIKANLADGLRYVHESPLQKTIGKDLAGLNLTGPMRLKLGLIVPLKHPEKSQVIGNVTTSNAILALPEWRLTLDQLKGSFQFTENGLEAKNLQGRFFGTPTILNITTKHGVNQATRIEADLIGGSITMLALQDWLKVPVSPIVSGSTAYQTQLFLSPSSSQGSHIILRSDLSGISVNLPAPYNKEAAEKRDFQVDIDVNEDQPVKIKLAYAKLISAALNMQQTPQGLNLAGGEIRLGGQPADWQTAPGLLIAGQMQQLDWNTWRDYFSSLQPGNNTAITAMPEMIRGIDLGANSMDLLGQHFTAARLQVSGNKEAWHLKLNSAEAIGELLLPINHMHNPIEAHFQRFYLVSSASSVTIDPKTLPGLLLDCADFRYNNKKFGAVKLKTVPTSNGLSIKQLHAESSLFNLDAIGEWSANANNNHSRLQGTASTKKFSALLTDWGFDTSNYVGSTGEAKFALSWPGAPFNPTIRGFSGNLSFKLGEGRIVKISEASDAKMGLGRMLNIFSLSTIPRRLSLNFSDLFEKGYSFDSIKGSFNLSDGNAITDNTRFDGPVARVEIKGRVGLAAKDFNMKLAVTPYVTGSLPMVAAIAGGPLVGVATWVVAKAVSGAVSNVTTYQYNVTGPWDNPVWEQTSAPPQKNTSFLSFPWNNETKG